MKVGGGGQQQWVMVDDGQQWWLVVVNGGRLRLKYIHGKVDKIIYSYDKYSHVMRT